MYSTLGYSFFYESAKELMCRDQLIDCELSTRASEALEKIVAKELENKDPEEREAEKILKANAIAGVSAGSTKK